MKKISFQSGDQKINGTLIFPKKLKEKNPAVLFFHGMTSSEKRYVSIAERIARVGFIGMTIDLRGHGESGGDFDKLIIADGMTDGLNAYDFLKEQRFVDTKRIGLCGASFGGAIAAIVASKRHVKSMVLRAPATYSQEMENWTYEKLLSKEGELFYSIYDPQKTTAVRAIERFEGNLLLISSENDVIIPKKVSEAFILSAKKAKLKKEVIIEGATHDLRNEKLRQRFIDATATWFEETL